MNIERPSHYGIDRTRYFSLSSDERRLFDSKVRHARHAHRLYASINQKVSLAPDFLDQIMDEKRTSPGERFAWEMFIQWHGSTITKGSDTAN